MAIIKPFKCVRPDVKLAKRVAALPYDVYNRQEALIEVEKEPLSFLRIDRAETLLDESIDAYDKRVYEKAKETLETMIENKVFVTDDTECYYIYELTMNGRAQTGIVACASIDDYQNNVIKKHEKTRADKEIDRITHVDTCNAQTGPIFLAYRSQAIINDLVAEKKKENPLYDFIADDGVKHTVWKIDTTDKIDTLKKTFLNVESIYIADGHHRAASAVKVGLKRREANKDHKGNEEYNYFLSVLFPNDQLMIMDYNRVIKDLNGHSKEEYLDLVAEKFQVENVGGNPYKPEKTHEIGMYLDNEWYKLTVKEEFLSSDPVEGLDVSILQNQLLTPILAIGDPRTDQRVDFIGGIRGLKELERRVQNDMKVAFAMYPTSIDELFAVSDADMLMPPKSTWFEPKLRSGLFIHKLD